ncbi:MAG TPA: ABC transporter permease [bacterium]|nr:ABC transporter permease [bacterium]
MVSTVAGTFRAARREGAARAWYAFSRNSTSVAGLLIVVLVVLWTAFAPWLTPFPRHARAFTDIEHANQPPGLPYLFGTDTIGRDIFTRVIFGYRFSLLLGVVVLSLAVPVGVALGLAAGYFRGWPETVIMRVTDVFLSIPPLALALAIMAVLEPNLQNAMLAVSVMWWPWYTRLVYSLVSSLRQEAYVQAAEVVGASPAHILLRELLPNCMPAILTKMTLDMAFVILIGSSLSYLGLGVQPPDPDLGTMVADGAKYMPDLWWISVFPGLAILVIVLGFNLFGDGLRDVFGVEV